MILLIKNTLLKTNGYLCVSLSIIKVMTLQFLKVKLISLDQFNNKICKVYNNKKKLLLYLKNFNKISI